MNTETHDGLSQKVRAIILWFTATFALLFCTLLAPDVMPIKLALKTVPAGMAVLLTNIIEAVSSNGITPNRDRLLSITFFACALVYYGASTAIFFHSRRRVITCMTLLIVHIILILGIGIYTLSGAW